MTGHEWWLIVGAGVSIVTAIVRLARESDPRGPAAQEVPPTGPLRGVPEKLAWSEGNQPNTGPSQGDQVVGEPCTLCEKSIMLAADAKRCGACRELVHKRCAKDHALLHTPKRPPYR
jgi:hypothetical protein